MHQPFALVQVDLDPGGPGAVEQEAGIRVQDVARAAEQRQRAESAQPPSNGLTRGSSIGSSARQRSMKTRVPAFASHGSWAARHRFAGFFIERSRAGAISTVAGTVTPWSSRSPIAAESAICPPAESPARLTLPCRRAPGEPHHRGHDDLGGTERDQRVDRQDHRQLASTASCATSCQCWGATSFTHAPPWA